MSTQRHIIKRQVIELKVKGGASAAQAQPLQDEISRIYRQRIIPILDQRFNEMSDPDKLYRIEMLELDLGRLDLQNLEADLVEKVRRALGEELSAQISAQERETGTGKEDLKIRSQLELFALFAQTGSLPWWAEASRPQLLSENLRYLLREKRVALGSLIRELARQPHPRQRMINQYTDDQLAELAALLIPTYKPFILRYYRFLIDMLPKTRLASGWQLHRLRSSFWNCFFQVASLAGSEYPSVRAFYQAVLVRLAIELGSTGNALRVEMEQALTHIKRTSEETTRATAQEIAQLLPSKTMEGDRSVSVDELPHVDQISQSARMKRTLTDEKTIPAESPQTTAGRMSQLLRSKTTEADFDLSEIEELYVENAGLVILWPFLEHFFGHVGLLDEKQFKDGAAQQRAVGLLQVLATQQPELPEYLLPLNKILCGLEVTEVFDFGPPLFDSEAEECEQLLEAVIDQAPILHDMSTAGFRGTFLLRAGMLSVRDGFWLLRVEKETYDVVLERFPWSWEWVKLPWMEAPLRVEWS
jgi:Contractile injection system tape measure protein